jgi:hypothetical protein
MSCCDDCAIPSEKNSCGIIAPQAPYTSTKNPYYATYNDLSQNFYTGQANPDYPWVNALPSSQTAFTLNPQNPLETGSNASQIVDLTASKTVFNSINVANAITQNSISPPLMNLKFKSYVEYSQYIKAMSSLRPGVTNQTYLAPNT